MSSFKELDTPSYWESVNGQALRAAKWRAKSELPADWLPIINLEAQAARAYHMRHAPKDPASENAVWRGYLEEFGGAAAAQLSDAQIKQQAKAYASEADDLDMGQMIGFGVWQDYARLVDFCRNRDVEPPPPKLLLKGMSARVRCQYWWRRALRKMVARKCERGAMSMGLVSASNRQPYASNKAVFRRVDQNARNKSALENLTFENDAGYRRTLAELAATSVSNKAIRRGELMTRIRGCEEMADECGHVGLFWTMTAPSRFHSSLRHGGRNPKYEGLTPREAQQWLCKRWELSRTEMGREGVKFYGFRVAEPHHDGCTHWHALLWFESELAMHQAAAIIGKRWLDEKLDLSPPKRLRLALRGELPREDGREPGAQEFRINCKRMERGGAAGYIAKYIAKNIDDHQIDSHHDDYTDSAIGPDLLGDLEIKPCMRVEAWASTWGIHQFQPLGQPPVTVWRELRRVTEAKAKEAGFHGIVHKAWLAAQKAGAENASWARYVKAQGGLMRGRRCNLVMRHDRREVDGQYGADVRNVPVGVALNCKGSRTVWSERRLWRAVDASPAPRLECAFGKRSAPARTRVNNCTPTVEKFRGWEGKTTPERGNHGNEKHYQGSSG